MPKTQKSTVLQRFSLDGKVAVITGASSGLGAGFARALADAGACVALGARRTERLVSVVDSVTELGGEAIGVATDVTDPGACAKLVDSAVNHFGRVDILVNNAGVGTAVPALKETPEEFRGVVDVNLLGLYWMAQAAARVMEPGSSIVNVSSVLGVMRSYAPQAAYSASKAGVLGLTRDLAGQWGSRKGIRVNAVAPGYFRSELTDEVPREQIDRLIDSRGAIKRMGNQEEIDAAVVFLASDAASYITGATLTVDGGLSA